MVVGQQNAISASARLRFDAAFVQAMRPFSVELYGEVLEGTRFPGEAQERLNRDYLAGKYADTPIDVVVAIGVEPLTFVREHGEIFGYPPVVAILSADGYLGRGDDVTGFQVGRGIDGTLELALAHTQAELGAACRAAHREMLQQRLAAIRDALASLP